MHILGNSTSARGAEPGLSDVKTFNDTKSKGRHNETGLGFSSVKIMRLKNALRSRVNVKT